MPTSPSTTDRPSPSKKRSRSKASATFYTVVGGNDTYWRVRAPAAAIEAKAILLPEKDAKTIVGQPNKGDLFPWSMVMTLVGGEEKRIHTIGGWNRVKAHDPPYQFTKLEAYFPKHEGVAVFTRPMFFQAVLSQAMRKQGIRTIAESDDNYFADPKLAIFMRETEYGEKDRITHAKTFAQQDACIFSTEWLRDRYYKEFRQRFGKQHLPELYVCHNNIPISDWPDRVERDGPVRVGFMGSTSHVWDINIAYAAIRAARDLGCHTTMIGYNPGDPEPGVPDVITDEDGNIHRVHSEKAVENREKWASAISQHIPWVASEEYLRAALPLDIGLCPLVSDDFSLSRSDVKAVEYTISGAAVVCTNNPVYNRFWKHEETCLMANSYQEMAEATIRLIKDHKLRYELVTAAQEKVASERGLDQLRYEWRMALSG